MRRYGASSGSSLSRFSGEPAWGRMSGMKLSPRSISFSMVAVFLSWMALAAYMDVPPIAIVGCTPQEAKDVRQGLDTALDVLQLGCLMNGLGGFITDAEAAAKVCNVAPKLVPIVSDLIGVRDAARKSGVVWKGSGLSDAGAITEAGAAR